MVNLTIGGGSFKGLCFIGALDYLHTKNLINVIDNFYGCSVGSLIGILYIIGYKPCEMLKILLKLNLNDYSNFSINNLEKSFSLLDDNFFNICNNIFSEKENINITIKDFVNKYGININIFAVNINTRQIVNFNTQNFPDLKVVTAIKASCSVPILFPPVIINNEYYVDGCFKCLNGDFHRSKKDQSNINLGYIIRLKYTTNEKINGFFDYTAELIKTIMINNNLIYTKNTIEINTDQRFREKTTFNDITNSDKIELYYEGLKQCSVIMEKIN